MSSSQARPGKPGLRALRPRRPRRRGALAGGLDLRNVPHARAGDLRAVRRVRRRPPHPRHRAGRRAAVHRLRRRAWRLHLRGLRPGSAPPPPRRLRQLRPGRAAGRPARRRNRPHPARAGAVRRGVLPDEAAQGRDHLDRPPARPGDAPHAGRPGHAGHARDAQRHVAVAVGGLPARPADAARRPAARRPQPDAVRALAGRDPGRDRPGRAPPARRALRLLACPPAAARLRRPRPGHRQADPAGPRRVRLAIAFLAWLHGRGRTLAGCRQADSTPGTPAATPPAA